MPYGIQHIQVQHGFKEVIEAEEIFLFVIWLNKNSKYFGCNIH